MPFTVSHAAAVLPFRRTRLPWAALVIGSFGPDFEYFLRVDYSSRAWHHYPDVLLFCLPFTVFAYFLFHILIKEPVAALLPEQIQRRIALHDGLPRTAGACVGLLAALGLGIATHLAWDAVTHAYSWPWRHFAILRKLLYRSHFTGEVYGFELAQTLSSVGGLLVLLVACVLWFRRTPARSRDARMFSATTRWVICVGLVLIALAAGAYTAHLRLRAKDVDFPQLLVISGIAWFMWEVVAYSVIMFLRGRG